MFSNSYFTKRAFAAAAGGCGEAFVELYTSQI
jgi:hypothetical protein